MAEGKVYDRAELERLLTAAQDAQTVYWDALQAIETEIGNESLLDDVDDIEGYDVDGLIALDEKGEDADAS